jgi:hypothetical protein
MVTLLTESGLTTAFPFLPSGITTVMTALQIFDGAAIVAAATTA